MINIVREFYSENRIPIDFELENGVKLHESEWNGNYYYITRGEENSTYFPVFTNPITGAQHSDVQGFIKGNENMNVEEIENIIRNTIRIVIDINVILSEKSGEDVLIDLQQELTTTQEKLDTILEFKAPEGLIMSADQIKVKISNVYSDLAKLRENITRNTLLNVTMELTVYVEQLKNLIKIYLENKI